MPRAKRGFKARRRRNKIFKLAKGFHYDRRRTWRKAAETVKRALNNSYKSRRLFKRTQRRLWIVRINAAANDLGLSYSKLIHLLKENDVQINRKMLADMAATDFESFKKLVESVNK